MGRLARIVTIGVYGFDESSFFEALKEAQVDTFLDVRLRRGLRGSQYAFANSRRLQLKLAALEIGYFHLKSLAPPQEIRAIQNAYDRQAGISKRMRSALSPDFIQAYTDRVLAEFEPRSVLDLLEGDAHVAVLCCVEKGPEACHRSLLAQKLAHELNIGLEHLLPWKS